MKQRPLDRVITFVLISKKIQAKRNAGKTFFQSCLEKDRIYCLERPYTPGSAATIKQYLANVITQEKGITVTPEDLTIFNSFFVQYEN